MPDLTRREFLERTAVAGAAVTLGDLSPRIAPTNSPESRDGAAADPEWVDRPMRWAQLTLVEDDPGKFDPAVLARLLQAHHADAVCLSAGGCVAYYPTKVPFHHRSAWLGDRDPFGDLVAGLPQAGHGRHRPHRSARRPTTTCTQAHPDWIAVDADGQQRRHWASPELWVTCALGPYNFEFMTEVTRRSCRLPGGRHLHQPLGRLGHVLLRALPDELPRRDRPRPAAHRRPQDPARRAYIVWRQERLFELWRLWDAEIRKVNPDSRVIPNTGGGATQLARHAEHRRARAHPLRRPPGAPRAHAALGQRQERQGVSAPRWARKPIGGIFSVGRRGAVPLEGLRAERRRDPHVGGRRHRQRTAPLVHQVRRQHPRPALAEAGRGALRLACTATSVPAQRGAAGARRAGLLAADRPGSTAGARTAKVEDHTLGLYQALVEARIPFEMVHDRLLDDAASRAVQDARPAQYRRAVRRAVRAAPRIRRARRQPRGDVRDVAVRRVGRAAEGLRSRRPVRRIVRRQRRTRRCRTRICGSSTTRARRRHPLLAGLEDAPRIINGVHRVDVDADGGVPGPRR